MATKVLVADDHEIVRAGVEEILNGADFEVVASVATGGEAIALAGELDVDVVLLDVVMPDIDGITALGRLRGEYPNLPVLMFSNHDNPRIAARCVALGAAGFLQKTVNPQRLITSLETTVKHGSIWTREELRRVTGSLASPLVDGHIAVPLTQRESEVLFRIARGLSNKEIGDALDISYETVKEHVQHILRKVGVVDRTQAAIWAVRNELA